MVALTNPLAPNTELGCRNVFPNYHGMVLLGVQSPNVWKTLTSSCVSSDCVGIILQCPRRINLAKTLVFQQRGVSFQFPFIIGFMKQTHCYSCRAGLPPSVGQGPSVCPQEQEVTCEHGSKLALRLSDQ